jgi:hypothetical protein
MNESALPLPDALQEWVAGWYWRTDDQGRLLTFRPGTSAIGGSDAADEASDARLNWQALSDHVALQPAWLALWDISQHGSSGWQHMAYLMSQGLGWSQPLSLPWPAALPGWWPARESRPGTGTATVQLRASPLRDAQGVCVGFQGVCQPVLAPAQAPSAPQSDEPGMTPAEQEALRYALSHDLRAPLRVVDGFSRIVKEDYAAVLGKLGLDHIERVLAASARMSGMIDAILSQAQLGSTCLERQVADVSAMALEVCNDLRASTDVATRVTFEVEPGLSVDADPVMLRRVLDNLIGNAVKYSAKVAQPRVNVGCMPSTNPAVFFVKDNGAGFDMQHADKLFGMFQRLHSAKEFPGTGVGLAGVQQIVRRHGGRIWAEARPGEGACFYFTLMDITTAQQKLV